MNAATDHPTDTMLAQFKRGELNRFVADAVRGHLAGCAGCAARLTAATGDTDAPLSGGSSVPGARVAGGGTADPPPPELLALTQYRDFRILGRGGMGAVYLARNTGLDRDEVLKVLGRDMVASPRAAERFRREIQAAAKLNHPNVVTAYAILTAGDLLVFAMEYVPGEDLDQRVKRGGPLKVHEAAYYAYQVALGLQHAHDKGMVHRDIKPSNLILHKDGRRRSVKILDFGLAKAVQGRDEDTPTGAGLTGDGKMLGTPWYMAPEQSSDAAKVDGRADVYALGCTLYFLLTGRPPFTGSDMLEVLMAHRTQPPPWLPDERPEVPAGLAEAVSRMLAKRPDERFPTPSAAADALKPYLTAAGVSARSADAIPAPAQPADFDVVEEAPPAPPPAARMSRSGPPVAAPRPKPIVADEPEDDEEDEDEDRPVHRRRPVERRRPQRKLPVVPLAVGGGVLVVVVGLAVALSGGRSADKKTTAGTEKAGPPVFVEDQAFADDKRKLGQAVDATQLAEFVTAARPDRRAAWEAAAAANNPDGMVLLAASHQKRAADARGKQSDVAAKNDLLAADWFAKAAALGHPGGMAGLGVQTLYGWGVDKDPEKAIALFRQAADRKHPDGMYQLGRCYAQNLVPGATAEQNLEMAAVWYEKAAALGHPAAMNDTGHAYCFGNGVTKDYAVALDWFRKAEAKGNATAMYNLGVCYLEGYGVPADKDEALRWLKKGAEAGNLKAKTKLAELEKKG